MRDLRPGDIVHCQGIAVTIAEVISCDYWGDKPENFTLKNGIPSHDWGYFCEFTDEKGRYRYWKQYIDGGYAELKGDD